jgi:hypothetical protein
MRTNSAVAGTTSVEPEPKFLRKRCSNLPSPPPSTTVVSKRTSMFSAASSSWMRYSDMLVESELPRTRSVTREAYLLRWVAACPAELAPPTT